MKKNKRKNTTLDSFLSDPKQKKLFDEEYQDLLLSELILAAMEDDNVSVRKLAKEAGVSPTIVQGLRSGSKSNINFSTFRKIFGAMGYQFLLEKNGKRFHI